MPNKYQNKLKTLHDYVADFEKSGLVKSPCALVFCLSDNRRSFSPEGPNVSLAASVFYKLDTNPVDVFLRNHFSPSHNRGFIFCTVAEDENRVHF
jgi:hypothetical protein